MLFTYPTIRQSCVRWASAPVRHSLATVPELPDSPTCWPLRPFSWLSTSIAAPPPPPLSVRTSPRISPTMPRPPPPNATVRPLTPPRRFLDLRRIQFRSGVETHATDPSQSGAAAAWDAEYAAGRYSGEPPVAFTGDTLAAARQAGLTRGLYIGCGNGRNYLPLVAGGLDLTGMDISAAAIAQLAARAPDRTDRLVCGDLGA